MLLQLFDPGFLGLGKFWDVTVVVVVLGVVVILLLSDIVNWVVKLSLRVYWLRFYVFSALEMVIMGGFAILA